MLPAVDDGHRINSPLFKAATRAFVKLKAFIHYIRFKKHVKAILKIHLLICVTLTIF